MSDETIFVTALELADQARQIYLDEACSGNPDLRKRIDLLLNAHKVAGDFLESPSPGTAQPFTTTPLKPGTVIDHYRLVQLLGEGGMGSVYLAEQNEPVFRQVALKVIKPGLSSPQILTRFDTERQALALMDHPNIARVIDGGTIPIPPPFEAESYGQPYFVMELVDGIAINEYCDTHCLHPQARLELFVTVCQAVQHAHQRGIIHRDLKPSNILITECDGKPAPKIIDFGVAKALGHSLHEQTLHSMIGMLLGTLEYMSPEQANLTTSDVDTRSDVYSLGVLLYELLTSTTPLQSNRLKTASMGEALRIIREVDPPKPSARLSNLYGSVASISAHRHVEPRLLTKLVQGELDWIVMKALEKDRGRRYESASSFALDVQRYLTNRPVEAGPPSHIYRLKKFVRRNRLGVTATALLLMTLIAGIIGTSYGFYQADSARIIAEQRLDIAQEAVAKYLDQITDSPDLNREDHSGLRIRLLHSAIPFYRRLIQQKPSGVSQRLNHAKAQRRLGQIRMNTAELIEAENDLNRARHELTMLAAESAAAADLHLELGITMSLLGRIHYAKGEVILADRDYDDAEQSLKKALITKPGDLIFVYNLATTQTLCAELNATQNQPVKARELFAKASENYQWLLAHNPREVVYRMGYALLLQQYALHLNEQNNTENADRQMAESQRILEVLVSETKGIEYRQALVVTMIDQCQMLSNRHRYAEAKVATDNVIRVCEKLVRDAPSLPSVRKILAFAYHNLGICYHFLKVPQQSLEAYQQSCLIREQLVRDYPGVGEYAHELAASYCNIGNVQTGQGRSADAYPWYNKAEALLHRIMNQQEASELFKLTLHNVHFNRSVLLERDNRLEEAAQDAQKAVELATPARRNENRLWHAMILTSMDRHIDAVKEAEEVAAAKEVQAFELILASMVCSLAVDHGSVDPEAIRAYSTIGKSFLKRAKQQLQWEVVDFITSRNADAKWALAHTRSFQIWLSELRADKSLPESK